MCKYERIIIFSILLSISFFYSACKTNNKSLSNQNNEMSIKSNDSANNESYDKQKEPIPNGNISSTKKESNNSNSNSNTSSNSSNKKKNTTENNKNVIVSSFSTKILDYDENRIYNIKLASQKLNKCVLKPGEVFSFNEIVGKREYGNGYKKAAVIVNGEHNEDVGGGVCQLSSTLYNVARKLNLEIIERHSHSGNVNYVKLGQDAAVSYGYMDLKFKNTMEYSVTFRTSVENGRVSVSILKVK